VGHARAATFQRKVGHSRVLFADGQLVGPDRSGSFDRYSAWLSGWDDLLQELREPSRQTLSDSALREWLASKKARQPTNFTDRDNYGIGQQLLAERLLRIFSTHGRARLVSEVERQITQTRLHLRH
jgi:hypothetical protein